MKQLLAKVQRSLQVLTELGDHGNPKSLQNREFFCTCSKPDRQAKEAFDCFEWLISGKLFCERNNFVYQRKLVDIDSVS